MDTQKRKQYHNPNGVTGFVIPCAYCNGTGQYNVHVQVYGRGFGCATATFPCIECDGTGLVVLQVGRPH